MEYQEEASESERSGHHRWEAHLVPSYTRPERFLLLVPSPGVTTSRMPRERRLPAGMSWRAGVTTGSFAHGIRTTAVVAGLPAPAPFRATTWKE
jgi:hypothetical protein